MDGSGDAGNVFKKDTKMVPLDNVLTPVPVSGGRGRQLLYSHGTEMPFSASDMRMLPIITQSNPINELANLSERAPYQRPMFAPEHFNPNMNCTVIPRAMPPLIEVPSPPPVAMEEKLPPPPPLYGPSDLRPVHNLPCTTSAVLTTNSMTSNFQIDATAMPIESLMQNQPFSPLSKPCKPLEQNRQTSHALSDECKPRSIPVPVETLADADADDSSDSIMLSHITDPVPMTENPVPFGQSRAMSKPMGFLQQPPISDSTKNYSFPASMSGFSLVTSVTGTTSSQGQCTSVENNTQNNTKFGSQNIESSVLYNSSNLSVSNNPQIAPDFSVNGNTIVIQEQEPLSPLSQSHTVTDRKTPELKCLKDVAYSGASIANEPQSFQDINKCDLKHVVQDLNQNSVESTSLICDAQTVDKSNIDDSDNVTVTGSSNQLPLNLINVERVAEQSCEATNQKAGEHVAEQSCETINLKAGFAMMNVDHAAEKTSEKINPNAEIDMMNIDQVAEKTSETKNPKAEFAMMNIDHAAEKTSETINSKAEIDMVNIDQVAEKTSETKNPKAEFAMMNVDQVAEKTSGTKNPEAEFAMMNVDDAAGKTSETKNPKAEFDMMNIELAPEQSCEAQNVKKAIDTMNVDLIAEQSCETRNIKTDFEVDKVLERDTTHNFHPLESVDRDGKSETQPPAGEKSHNGIEHVGITQIKETTPPEILKPTDIHTSDSVKEEMANTASDMKPEINCENVSGDRAAADIPDVKQNVSPSQDETMHVDKKVITPVAEIPISEKEFSECWAKIEECQSLQAEESNTKSEEMDLSTDQADGHLDFTWDDYLEFTSTEAVPPFAFKHVEQSLESCIVKGMRLEVINKDPDDTYWIATIVMPAGQLLRLRHLGQGDCATTDFWCDAFSSDIHPLGWAKQNGKMIAPPTDLKEKLSNWEELLQSEMKSSTTAPASILESKNGIMPVDHIKPEMMLEIQDVMNPLVVWIVRVIQNVGGRLLLRCYGIEDSSHDFWLFYLHSRLHPPGWGADNGCSLQIPEVVKQVIPKEIHLEKMKEDAVVDAEKSAIPAFLFQDQCDIQKNEMKVGMKLEALHPKTRSSLHPATVTKVINEVYFIVRMDDVSPAEERECVEICCHSSTPVIFPVDWCFSKGLKLTPPRGWTKSLFHWNDYLGQTCSEPAPDSAFILNTEEHEFQSNMKLEAINPELPGEMCVATVTRIVQNLLWIHLESSVKIMASHVVDTTSQDLFPVGWCESNNYPLKPPRKSLFCQKKQRVAVVQPETRPSSSHTYTQMKEAEVGSGWCPKIYFNHRCFSGPLLSKGRIAELPKCVGPGPVELVLKEVLTMLISVAYKSSRVLREIQVDGPANPKMTQQILKAKYKGKSYRATVEICKSSEQIVDFCRRICFKLECCPNLFAPTFVGNSCPENCSQLTKTKYTMCYQNQKKAKRKIGRPPGGHTNLEKIVKKPGRRKRRRRIGLISPKKRPSVDSEEAANGESKEVANLSEQQGDYDVPDDDTNSTASLDRRSEASELTDDVYSRRKRRKLENVQKSIQTRGAKYSFERRTHKKIMIPDLNKSPRRKHKSAFQMVVPTVKQESSSPIPKREDILVLPTNPLYWSIQEVMDYIRTTDSAASARLLREQEIDGQALLLLTLPTVQDHLDLKLGPAVKLCHQVERVKIAFFEQYATYHN